MVVTNRKPPSISTMTWLTLPAPMWRAAPAVRLARPDVTAASGVGHVPGQVLGQRQHQPVGRQDDDAGDSGMRSGEAGDEPVEIAVIGAAVVTGSPGRAARLQGRRRPARRAGCAWKRESMERTCSRSGRAAARRRRGGRHVRAVAAERRGEVRPGYPARQPVGRGRGAAAPGVERRAGPRRCRRGRGGGAGGRGRLWRTARRPALGLADGTAGGCRPGQVGRRLGCGAASAADSHRQSAGAGGPAPRAARRRWADGVAGSTGRRPPGRGPGGRPQAAARTGPAGVPAPAGGRREGRSRRSRRRHGASRRPRPGRHGLGRHGRLDLGPVRRALAGPGGAGLSAPVGAAVAAPAAARVGYAVGAGRRSAARGRRPRGRSLIRSSGRVTMAVTPPPGVGARRTGRP